MDYQGFIGRGGGGGERGKLLPPPQTPQLPPQTEGRREGGRERERWGEGGRDVEPEGSNNIIIIRWGC